MPPSSPSSPPPGSTKHARRRPDAPPPVPSKDTEYTLDKDIDNMEGIVDLAKHYELYDGGGPDSPSSGFESSLESSARSSDAPPAHKRQREE